MNKKRHKIITIILMLLWNWLDAQDTTKLDRLISVPDKLFDALDTKTKRIEEKLDRQTEKYLSRLQKQEHKLKRKLSKKDLLLAEQTFGDIKKKYQELKNVSAAVNKNVSVYSGHLDSLSTALSFLRAGKLSSNPAIQRTLSQYKDHQSRLNASDQIKKQLLQRQQMLQDQFQKLGIVKQLKQFRKQVYYYQAQVRQYREMFEHPSKLEAMLIEMVMKLPEFKTFFANNSVLGSLFALPGSSVASSVSLAGLQTRASVNQSIADRIGSGPDIAQQLRQNMQSGQGLLSELKNKTGSFSSCSYGNGEADIPDFRLNGQKTKSFRQRLEYGANVQSQKARYFFPVTSDIGLSLGYKLNDRFSIGIGASYKLGWGRGWDNISITHQGVGLRSYMDCKIKGSFYLSGGYEQNYQTLIHCIDQLRQYSSWQRSGLVGVSRRYKVSKKIKGEMKLMWDFLSQQQVPRTQAIVFRVGYNLK